MDDLLKSRLDDIEFISYVSSFFLDLGDDLFDFDEDVVNLAEVDARFNFNEPLESRLAFGDLGDCGLALDPLGFNFLLKVTDDRDFW